VTGSVRYCMLDTPFIEVLRCFHADKCSAVPITDSGGKMIAVVTKSDIRGLVKSGIWESLNQSVGELLSFRYRGKGPDILPRIVTMQDTLDTVMSKLAARDVYRLFILDSTQKIIGRITLTRFMRFVLIIQ
jgi:predicted transcriptional regulator